MELLQLHIFVHCMHLSLFKGDLPSVGRGRREGNGLGPSFALCKGLKCIFVFLFVILETQILYRLEHCVVGEVVKQGHQKE